MYLMIAGCETHPTAPVPKVIKSTLTPGFSAKSVRILLLVAVATLPYNQEHRSHQLSWQRQILHLPEYRGYVMTGWLRRH